MTSGWWRWRASNIAVARFGAAGEIYGMKILLGLIAAIAAAGPIHGQVAGGGGGQGRVGGISYVTRRVPTSTAGGQAGAFFGAGGVSGLSAGSAVGGGTVAVAAPVARSADSDQRALTALRQLAATGDRSAQRLLQNPAVLARLSNQN